MSAVPNPAAPRGALTPRCLLVSADAGLIGNLLPLFESNGIAVETCADLELARALLAGHRFDGAALDCDVERALSVIPELRNSPATKNLVLLALADRVRLNGGLLAGANFAIEKPILSDLAIRTIRTSYRFMLAERRRYYRLAVEFPVALSFGDRDVEVTAVNLSEGGMGIAATHPLATGTRCSVRFRLPISGEQICVNGEVAWAGSSSRAGIRFTGVAESLRSMLDLWLTRASYGEVVPAGPTPPDTAAQAIENLPRRDHAQAQAASLGGRLLTAVLVLFILFVLAFWLAVAGFGSILANFAGLMLGAALLGGGVFMLHRNPA